jgi:hypothetical protein
MASMSPSIAKMVEVMREAAKIWKTLSNMYSGKGNVMMMMEIQGKADAVKQEGKTVEQYASELQYLWGELDHYAPLRMETPNDAIAVKKWVEDRRVTQFLKGLNSEFENRRAAICHQDSLPSLEEAISAMVQEEIRQRVMGDRNHVTSACTITDDRVCFNCGEKGHLSYNCPQPKNYNSYEGYGNSDSGSGGHGRGHSGRGGCGGYNGGRGGRGGYDGGRGGRGRGKGQGGTRAHAAMTEETPQFIFTADQAAEWEAWQKSKKSENSTSISPQGPMTTPATHFGNFANYACEGEGTQAQALASSYHPHLDWIIDSGASKHVTGIFDIFSSYTPYTHLETIQTADGTSQPIKGVGSVG